MNATILVKTWGSLVLAMAATVTALPVAAQETGTLVSQTVSMSQQAQNYIVLHVDAAMGDDQRGSGSADQPYKTITQALAMAPNASTVILLAPGHYSQASGEQFPLRLRPGVTIQGNAGEARNTMIVGGGEFRDAGVMKHATIVTSDRSGLANLAISNPKGSGVWINAGTPVLRRLVLMSNAVAGVQVADSAPMIENSYFHQNQLGLAIQGESRATVRGNYFEATGRAITVASPATPTINNNRIARNDVGIALKNNARPILEANVLNGNGRNGVVEVESTSVASVAAMTTGEAVPARPEVEPETDLIVNDDAETNTTTDTVRAYVEAGSFRQHLAASISSGSAEQSPIVQLRQIALSAPANDASTTASDPPLDEGAVAIAVIPASGPDMGTNIDAAANNGTEQEGISKLLARLRGTSPTDAGAASSSVPVEVSDNSSGIPSDRLLVPSVAIPGSRGAESLTPPGTVSVARVFRYQVLVDMAEAEDLQVLVPDAFRTQVGSRTFMQAGAYVDEAEAQERLDWLQDNGIEARVNLRE
ncbi:MAG: DUF1565 domain-containing protein [Cyanobacteria bacterium P01_F01_bin.116]